MYLGPDLGSEVVLLLDYDLEPVVMGRDGDRGGAGTAVRSVVSVSQTSQLTSSAPDCPCATVNASLRPKSSAVHLRALPQLSSKYLHRLLNRSFCCGSANCGGRATVMAD